MKVAQHFGAEGAVSKRIRPGGTIEMVELWPRMRGKASTGKSLNDRAYPIAPKIITYRPSGTDA
ncbi:MAG TPA: hypothetical protein VFO40_09135 [Chthoniobacterales bacterium]|nr:hypothetical protein [Chthoniobacterales bacterium]